MFRATSTLFQLFLAFVDPRLFLDFVLIRSLLIFVLIRLFLVSVLALGVALYKYSLNRLARWGYIELTLSLWGTRHA